MKLQIDSVQLEGDLLIPKGAKGLVIFAHGSGSSRLSPRNRFVAKELNKRGLATFLFDLLTLDEEKIDIVTAELRFDIPFLASRLISVVKRLQEKAEIQKLKMGYFGSSTGAGAALIAAALYADPIYAVVSRGGRPDLAEKHLKKVHAPCLFIVGGNDEPVIDMNKSALTYLTCEKKLEIVPGATHLFEEPGKLEIVAKLAGDWFLQHLS